MKITTPFVFVRHPESFGNNLTADERAKLSVPNHEYDITIAGHEQAKIVGLYLASTNLRLNSFFQSTFFRTQQGMSEILRRLSFQSRYQINLEKSPVVTDARLDEKWDGIFHELTKSEIEKRYPEQIRLKARAGYYHYRAPGGQSCPDVEMRIRSFVNDYLCEPPKSSNEYALIVGHGRWFQIFQKLLHDLTVDEFLYLKDNAKNKNCSVWVYTPESIGRGLNNVPTGVVPWEGQVEVSGNEFA